MSIKERLDQLKEKYDGTSFSPLFNAFHTFLFVPKHTTHTGSHIRDAADMKRTMITVVIALMPCFFFGAYNTGYQYYSQIGGDTSVWICFLFGLGKILPLIAVSYGVGLGIEFLFAMLRKHEVNEGYLVTGLLIPLILPVDSPIWMLASAVIFSVVIGKEVFGGTGMNVLNPALLARAFLFFAYPKEISGDKVWVHNGGLDGISGESLIGFLANAKDQVELSRQVVLHGSPVSVQDMFLGFIPGSFGETSVIAVLIAAALLIFTGIGSWRIMFSAVVGASVVGFLFNAWGANALMAFPWWKHLIVGGFAFGIVFMATDPVSSAQTQTGKWIYGFFVGFFSILIRIFNPAYPEGVMMAILLMNVFAPTIDHFVVQANINRRIKRLKTKKYLIHGREIH
ncbi:MAG: NADH:ubiquinone reductase (Na(+)-transporting) subunit B [Flavobacteriales bacterium Tduv]